MTCENSFEAHLLKGKLNNEGIDCFVTNENTSILLPYLNMTTGFGINIMIKKEDYDAAYALVKDKVEPNNKVIVCPYCGSQRVGLGLGNHKWMKLFSIFFALMAFVPLGNLKPKYFCKDCKQEIR